MKFMRLAACAVAFAVVGGMAVAEDMDIKALQAKLAAQEARLNDLQAKMGSGAAEAPASIMSLKKNAKVTIGGSLDFRYVYDSIEKTDSHGDVIDTINQADAFVDTADLRIGVEVNEHFDAFMRISGHDNADRSTGIVRDAWVRWKNICNSGWGILVGRDGLKFGLNKPIGMWDAWIQDDNSRTGVMGGGGLEHLNYGVSRTTQINPYWESCDGKFRFDLSLFQNLDARNAAGGRSIVDVHAGADGKAIPGLRGKDIHTVNYGLGSGTVKLTWKPTEDWTVVAGVANLYVNARNGDIINKYTSGKGGVGAGGRYGQVVGWDDDVNSSSNTALHFGFIYNPAAFCKKLTLWAQATQEFNTGFVKDQDFFGTNFGLSYALTDKFTAFAQGDYVNGDRRVDGGANDLDISGYRAWVGGVYNMGNGVALEAGYSYEKMETEFAATSALRDEATANTVYTRLTFDF